VRRGSQRIQLPKLASSSANNLREFEVGFGRFNLGGLLFNQRLLKFVGRQGTRRRGNRARMAQEAELVSSRNRRPHDPSASPADDGTARRRLDRGKQGKPCGLRVAAGSCRFNHQERYARLIAGKIITADEVSAATLPTPLRINRRHTRRFAPNFRTRQTIGIVGPKISCRIRHYPNHTNQITSKAPGCSGASEASVDLRPCSELVAQ
jgi:hypothetical protein